MLLLVLSLEILPRIQFILKMNSIIEQFFLVGDGKEGKFAFALQSQELFKCQGVNFTDRITMQLQPRFDGKEKSLSREDGRSMIGWNAVHPCFILTRISKKFWHCGQKRENYYKFPHTQMVALHFSSWTPIGENILDHGSVASVARPS